MDYNELEMDLQWYFQPPHGEAVMPESEYPIDDEYSDEEILAMCSAHGL